MVTVIFFTFVTVGAHAESAALRISCSGDNEGAVIYLNGKKKGECPDDFFVESGNINIRAVKVIDDDYERIFADDIYIEDIKRVRVTLSEPRLNVKALERQRLATIQKNKKMASVALNKSKEGDVEAMNTLAGYYASGHGVEKSQTQSDYWKNKATETQQYNFAMQTIREAEKGDLKAVDKIINMYTTGDGIEADLEKAQQWENKKIELINVRDEYVAKNILIQAESGDLESMKTAASLYKTGKGVEQSEERSKAWEDSYNEAVNEQRLKEQKDAEIQQMKVELNNMDYFPAFHLFQDVMQQGDGILAVFAITILPTATVSTVIDVITAPYRTTQQTMLENEIEAHAAVWGSPNSMVAKASR